MRRRDSFDPLYYAKRYPHIGLSPKCLLEHYLTVGKKNSYRPLSIATELEFDTSRIEQNRETVLLVNDQARALMRRSSLTTSRSS